MWSRMMVRAKRVVELVRVRMKRRIIWVGVGPRYCIDLEMGFVKMFFDVGMAL